MKATEQCFPVVLFIVLYEVVLTFASVDEILKSDNSNESYWVVLSGGAVWYAVQGGCKALFVHMKSSSDLFPKWCGLVFTTLKHHILDFSLRLFILVQLVLTDL